MKTLIILHGWQSSKEKWQKVKEEIETSGIKVVVPDIPGFKPETALSKAWTLDDYVDWLRDFIGQSCQGGQADEGFFLLGHSFGGRIAIKFAANYPQGLLGLILVSAAGIKKHKTLPGRILGRILETGAGLARILNISEAPLTKKFWAVFRKFFYRFMLNKTDYLEASGFLKDTIKNILAEDLTALLTKISIPTLILWGKEDEITPLEDAFLIKEKIKNSRLEILENIGHTPHLENPEVLAKKIKSFVG